MALTRHQRAHVLAMLEDTVDIRLESERSRVRAEAENLLDGTTPWPDRHLDANGIHDWVEKPDKRSDMQLVIDHKRRQRGG